MDFKNEISVLLCELTEIDRDEIYNLIEIPPDSDLGDYAFPCFKLSKILKKSPAIISNDLVAKVMNKLDFVVDVKSVGPYVNFYVNKEVLAENILSKVIEEKELYGQSSLGKGKTITIDFSSPNLAKELHIGHLYTTLIGNSLCQIYKALGFNVVGINYVGDWGTQFGKLIVGYKLFSNEELVKAHGVKELTRVYVKFNDELKLKPELIDEARNWLLKMQNNDEEAISLWKWFKDISIIEIDKTYKRLDIKFDSYRGESSYNDLMLDVVDELKEKSLLVESQGAMIVDLEPYKMPPCLVLRTDGGTLYPTRDIATAIERKSTYDFYKSIYITDVRQSLHFAQFIKVIELMGYEWAKDLIHLPYGLVSIEGECLSSRAGNVILLEDIFNEAAKRVLNIINEKNPLLINKEEVAEEVGVGAVIFSTLFNQRIKDVDFYWDKILNFEGETGPYVQYTIARANSILVRADFNICDLGLIDYSLLTDNTSIEVIKTISKFNDKMVEAINKNEPFVLTRFMIELAQVFNKFYNEHQILTSEINLKKSRVALVYCAKTVLKSALALLGIKSPDKM